MAWKCGIRGGWGARGDARRVRRGERARGRDRRAYGWTVERTGVTRAFIVRGAYGLGAAALLAGGAMLLAGCSSGGPGAGTSGASGASGADVRSWVSADRASLDVVLYEAVSQWLRSAWPFTAVSYAPR